SANRRLTIPESFLTCDAILELLIKVTKSLVVYPQMIGAHLKQELPFMITESILMESVNRGGDRQELHEKIRQHAQAAASEVKNHGKNNDLLDRIAKDSSFPLTLTELEALMTSSEISGRSSEQV